MSREGGTSFHGQLQMVMEHKLESFFTSARCPIEYEICGLASGDVQY